MWVAPSGELYIADSGNERIRRVDPSGTISTMAGTGVPGYSGDGGPAVAAQFDGPRGLAGDGAGNLYVADDNNNRIRRIDPSGVITTVAGTGAADFSGDGGPARSAQLNHPRGVAVDGRGNVFIADTHERPHPDGGSRRDDLAPWPAAAARASAATAARPPSPGCSSPAGWPSTPPASSSWPTPTTTASAGSTTPGPAPRPPSAAPRRTS